MRTGKYTKKVEEIDAKLEDYKGQYFESDNKTFTCPRTGAHFDFSKMCRSLDLLQKQR